MEKPSFPADCHSAVSKHLTGEVWNQLAGTRDATGFQFEEAIASGVAHTDSSTGVYAGSEDSYRAFAPLLEPIITAYHGDRTHRSNWDGDVPALSAKAQDAVRSTRMRVARNLHGVPFGAAMDADDRRDAESQIVEALRALDGEYVSLADLSDEEQQQLVADHLLFKEGDRFMDAAGMNRDWPTGRGIFMDAARTALIWVGEEDHLRIISMQSDGDVHAVRDRLRKLHDALDERLHFAVDDRWGYLTSCPTNLGTGLRASVHVHLPNRSDMEDVARAHHVQVRGVHGEHSEAVGDVYDISNKRRLGFTEAELLTHMVGGVEALVEAETVVE